MTKTEKFEAGFQVSSSGEESSGSDEEPVDPYGQSSSSVEGTDFCLQLVGKQCVLSVLTVVDCRQIGFVFTEVSCTGSPQMFHTPRFVKKSFA